MKEKQQALIDAITTGQDSSTIHVLIEQLPSNELHFLTEDNTTALAEAARYGNHQIVADLIAHTIWTPTEARGAINTALRTIECEEIDSQQYTQTFALLQGLMLVYSDEETVTGSCQ